MLLKADGLCVERGYASLVEQLSFELSAGQIVQLAGPNGCGKSSVLKTLAGLSPAADGEIYFKNEPIHSSIRFRQRLNYFGHNLGLSLELNARENLASQAAITRRGNLDLINKALDRVGASAFAGRAVQYLSAGQRQRAALARLVLFEADLWLLDEPFTALDQQARGMLSSLIDQHLDGGGAAIVATHQSFTCAHPIEMLALDTYAAAPL